MKTLYFLLLYITDSLSAIQQFMFATFINLQLQAQIKVGVGPRHCPTDNRKPPLGPISTYGEY